MLKIVRTHKMGHDHLEVASLDENVAIKIGTGVDAKIVDLNRSEWDEIVETLR